VDKRKASVASWINYVWVDGVDPRKIRLIEGNAICRHLKKAAIYLSEAPPPPYTLYMYRHIHIRTCTYSHREGGVGVLNQREEERDNRGERRSQRWVENTNISSLNKLCVLNWGKCR
jgi:hypothetical protein